MSELSEVSALFNKLLVEKTFSMEALEGIKVLRDKAVKLEEDLKKALYSRDQYERELQRATQQIQNNESKKDALAAREAVVSKRETDMTKLEINSMVASAKFEVMSQFTSLLLKNRQIREEAMGSTPMPAIGGGYPTSAPTSNSVTKTEE